MTTPKQPNGDDLSTAFATSTEIPTNLTREAVETLARRQGQPVLDVLTQLQSAAALLDDNEVTLKALCAIKSELLEERLPQLRGPKFPDVRVQLVGQDGNVFAIIGRVSQALKKAGADAEDTKAFSDEVMSSGSYDEALAVVMRWVDVS